MSNEARALEELELRYQALVDFVTKLDDQERARRLEGLPDHPERVFDMVRDGDAVSLLLAVSEHPEVLTLQDTNRNTLLHHSIEDHSGLLTRILIDTPSMAVDIRNENGQTAFNLAAKVDNQLADQMLFVASYPEIYRDQALKDELSTDWLTGKLPEFERAKHTPTREQSVEVTTFHGIQRELER